MAKILPASPTTIAEAVVLLKKGRPVALPTETVYGLAADALDPEACARIFEAKGRPSNDPLIVHIAGYQQVEQLAYPNNGAKALAEAFWPGPLTILLRKKEQIVPDRTTSGLATIALRCPQHPVFLEVLRQSGLALAAPSANRFGKISPTTATAVNEELGNKIKLIIDGGTCNVGIESTIVDLTDPSAPQILRPGAITDAQIEKILHCKVITPDRLDQQTPGSFAKHYQPCTPLTLASHSQLPDPTAHIGVIYFYNPTPPPHSYNLSQNGSTQSAAANLYSLLRELDKKGYKQIFCEMPPVDGIGEAILNRLRRASAR